MIGYELLSLPAARNVTGVSYGRSFIFLRHYSKVSIY
jgi:hypothetical protein